MSCYVVEKNHIVFLVDAYSKYVLHAHGKFVSVEEEERALTGFANSLLAENVKTFCERYKGKKPEDYLYKFTMADLNKVYKTDLLQILESIRCYQYQTEGELDIKLERLKNAVIGKLTENCIWGAPEPVGIDETIRII